MLEIDYKPVHELYGSNPHNFEVGYVSEDYQLLHKIFDEKYNIADYVFSFDLCCSNLIKSLFKKFVGPKTIVISSRRDHPSVEECLKTFECKELIYLDDGIYLNSEGGGDSDPRLNRNSNDFSVRKLSDRLSNKDYDNIFFLSYGTNVCDGEVRDNRFFRRIFSVCDSHCENTIKVLDDCQGSLWIERDYSIFDYVLWTAHATLYLFDVGILLSAPNAPKLGVYDVGEEFLYDNYSRLLNNRDFVSSFNSQLSLATGVHLSCAPHLFCLRLKKDYPTDYFLDMQSGMPSVSQIANIKIDGNRFIRLRVEYFLNDKGKHFLLRALKYIYDEREFIDA